MSKEQFLQELKAALKNLPQQEREDILRDYEEHFQFGLEEGRSEAEIAKELGAPQSIAKEITVQHHVEKAESKGTAGNLFRAVWAAIGLGFFNLVIVLGPFIALAGLLFSGWAVSAAFILSPLLAIFDAVVFADQFELFTLFFSLVLAGAGIYIGIGMYYATKAIYKGFLRYLKFNVSLVKGGLKA
ncbi:DUF1700 domain-containing protein [Metabacillus sp. GX 13764]|uniref:HAAS signaling domain-containing protein n=1 Tax=Metabacillus kandeliae TaxID=2900151 RepID=UPI001E3D09E0|nr:DUF1700 domain-containing protein [Metabacillus kandeliae]MCD7034258.1 DUF1700 domain-containing protein [Metabacillus kandeliae]